MYPLLAISGGIQPKGVQAQQFLATIPGFNFFVTYLNLVPNEFYLYYSFTFQDTGLLFTTCIKSFPTGNK